MKPEKKRALAWGTIGAFYFCILVCLLEHVLGHDDVARVWVLAGLPWLALALWSDRR